MDAVKTDAEIRSENIERIKKFRFLDDVFARRAFKGQPKLVEFILRIITGKDDLVVDESEFETQYDAISLTESRSLLLDVLCGDSKGRKYDFEMEKQDATPERAEVHIGGMIAEHMRKGGQFKDLPECYVIFVYDGDPVGNGRAVNEFCFRNEDKFLEDKTLESGIERHASMKGKMHILFVNGSYKNDENAIGKLIHDLKCSSADEMFYPNLSERMKEVKSNPEEVDSMCKVLDEVREEGRAEGRVEGRAEGELSMRINDIRTVMESFGVTVEKAMDSLKVPRSEWSMISGLVNAV